MSNPQKIFSQLNLFLFKVTSLWLCANYFEWFTGHLNSDLLTLHVATGFKETALLFIVHLSGFKCLVDFILRPTNKYMFKVNNKKLD